MPAKKALFWFLFWVCLALAFDFVLYLFMGTEKAMMFLCGFVIEKSMSIDNLFIFLLIFTSFGLDSHCQRRVLNYGIFGVVILRLVFILLGVTIISLFHWVLYLLGAILIFSGFKVFKKSDAEAPKDYKDSRLFHAVGKIIPLSEELNGDRFFVRKDKKLYATPLIAIVVLIELSDIMFAIDSVPAIFSITTDVFLVYTSNIFAILGMRSLYFILETANKAFRYVKYGVGFILVFVGVKLVILLFHVEIPINLSLIVIFSTLFLSILSSVLVKEKNAGKAASVRFRAAPDAD
jgi:tellurite resistance protein TerC